MALRLLRRFEVQTGSVVLPPNGAFVAYIDKGVVFDDGKRRFLRGTAKRLTRGDGQLVRVATDEHIVITDLSHVSVVSLDGQVRTLAPADRHIPIHYHVPTNTMTCGLGARVMQFDATTWELQRTIDVRRDLDISSFAHCSANEHWIVLQHGARFVVLDAVSGDLETSLPSDQRGWPHMGPGDTLVASHGRGDSVHLSQLPRDDRREQWDGWQWTRWCAGAGEFRGTQKGDVVIRAADGSTTRHTCEPVEAGQTKHMSFADRAQMGFRWGLHARSFELYEW